MTAISLTRKACALLYSAPTSILIAEKCYRSVSGALQKGIKALVLESCGTIRCRNEELSTVEETIPLPGAPAGLLGIITCKEQSGVTQELVSVLEHHDKDTLVPILLLPAAPTFWRRYKYRQFINGALLGQLLSDRGKLGSLNSQLVQLRQSRERVQYQLEKARQMIAGIGYDHCYITADLAPGTETVGPGGAHHTTDYQQILPVACAGLGGVSFYVQNLPQNITAASLTVVIKRVADGHILAQHDIAAQDLVTGWNAFGVSETKLVSISDASVQILWHNADGLLLALSNETAERFGDADGKTLALRLYQSLQDPITFSEESQPAGELVNDIATKSYMRMSSVALPDMSGNFSYYQGYEAHEKLEREKGFPIVTMNGETRTLQIHPLEDGLAATVYKRAIPPGTSRAVCEIGTAHPEASSFTYILLALPSDTKTSSGVCIENICETIKDGISAGVDEKIGAAWNSVTVPANKRRLIELDFPVAPENQMDAVFAVIPAGNSVKFGWCRWYRFFIASGADIMITAENEGSDASSG